MANEKKIMDGITVTMPKQEIAKEPTVQVYIPLIEDTDGAVDIDQTVVVTINGNNTQIRRGEYVDVKIPVFEQLKNRFPNI